MSHQAHSKSLSERYAQLCQSINAACLRHGRDPSAVCLLAVSKGHDHDAIEQLYALGQKRFAESYLNEALKKQQQLAALDIEWHYIGRIQSNKTVAIANDFSWVHSVDRLKIAQRLNQQRQDKLPPLNICIQININDEASKGGISADDSLSLAQQISLLPKLRLRGLMVLPQRTIDFGQQRQAFSRLRQLRDFINTKGLHLDTLSMGMSGDYEAAIAEQSTKLRIGSVLFGPRPDLSA